MYLESRMQSFWSGLTRTAADQVLSELGAPNTISKFILKSMVQLNNSELPCEKELQEEVHEEEPAAAEAYEEFPSEPALAGVSEVEPQDEPRTAGDAVVDPGPLVQSFVFGATGEGQFSVDHSFVSPKLDG